MKRLFLDVETQGVDPSKNGVWQVSGCVDVKGSTESFNYILNPPQAYQWDQKAFEMYEENARSLGWNIERDGLSYEDFHQQFCKMLFRYVDKFDKKDKFFLIGFNVTFDDRFLREVFDYCKDKYYGSIIAWPPIDVAVIAANMLGEKRLEMQNFKLFSVAEEIGLKVDHARLHDASYDIELTMQIYYELQNAAW